jgi:hypothetical protein
MNRDTETGAMRAPVAMQPSLLRRGRGDDCCDA